MHNPVIYKEIGINIIFPTTSVCDHSSFPKEEIQDRIDFLIPQMEILLFDSFFIRIHFSFERNKLETIFFFGLIPKLTHLPTPLPHTSPHRLTHHLTHLHTPPHTFPAPPHATPHTSPHATPYIPRTASRITSHIFTRHPTHPPHLLPLLHPTRTVPRPTFFSVKRAPATER